MTVVIQINHVVEFNIDGEVFKGKLIMKSHDVFGSVYEIHPVDICDACGENSVGDCTIGDKSFCDRCVAITIGAIQLQDAITHLIEGDERIKSIVDIDVKERLHSMNEGRQYIDIDAVAHDALSGVDSHALINEWTESIANALRAMGSRS